MCLPTGRYDGRQSPEEVRQEWGCHVAGLMGLFFLIWFIKCRTVRVFIYDNMNEKVFAGWKWIYQSDEHYMVEISEKMIERCMTNRFCFCLDPFFVNRHQEEEISFLFPEKICITREIGENLEMTLS